MERPGQHQHRGLDSLGGVVQQEKAGGGGFARLWALQAGARPAKDRVGRVAETKRNPMNIPYPALCPLYYSPPQRAGGQWHLGFLTGRTTIGNPANWSFNSAR